MQEGIILIHSILYIKKKKRADIVTRKKNVFLFFFHYNKNMGMICVLFSLSSPPLEIEGNNKTNKHT